MPRSSRLFHVVSDARVKANAEIILKVAHKGTRVAFYRARMGAGRVEFVIYWQRLVASER